MLSSKAMRVVAWSLRIHGDNNDRHEWALKVATLLDLEAGGAVVILPLFPSHFRSTRISREETARRVYEKEDDHETTDATSGAPTQGRLGLLD